VGPVVCGSVMPPHGGIIGVTHAGAHAVAFYFGAPRPPCDSDFFVSVAVDVSSSCHFLDTWQQPQP